MKGLDRKIDEKRERGRLVEGERKRDINREKVRKGESERERKRERERERKRVALQPDQDGRRGGAA